MKIGDIFAGSGSSTGVYRAPTRQVKIKLIGDNEVAEQTVAETRAVLRFVPEDAAAETRVAAEKELREQFPDGNPPSDLVADARAFHLLQRALRDADDPRQPFAMSVKELRASLQRREALGLFASYTQFVTDEFPEHIDDDLFAELVDEAAKKSLSALLSSHDSSKILRALPSLVEHFGRSPTPTSGDGEPG